MTYQIDHKITKECFDYYFEVVNSQPSLKNDYILLNEWRSIELGTTVYTAELIQVKESLSPKADLPFLNSHKLLKSVWVEAM